MRGADEPVQLSGKQLDQLAGVPSATAAKYADNGVGAADDIIIGWGQGIQKQGLKWEDDLAKSFDGTSTTRLPPGANTFDFINRETGERSALRH